MKAADPRRLAVSLHLDDGQSLESAAQNTRMSRRSLTRFLSNVAETGDVHYAPEKWNTHADNFLRCPDLRSAVLVAVEQCPEAFLDEISDFVTHLHQLLGDDFSISPSSVSRVLAAHGFTRKVIESAFISRNELARARWVHDQWDIPLRARVYIDEAHRCGRSADPKWAWSLRGARAECYLSNAWGVSTSFFVAMSHDAVLDWKITQPPPGQSSVDFLLFTVENLLPHLNAYDPTFVGGFARQRLVVTFWRLRGDTHTACVATKSPTGATGKMKRTHQRSTWPYRNTATWRIYLLAKFYDQLEIYCSSYERC